MKKLVYMLIVILTILGCRNRGSSKDTTTKASLDSAGMAFLTHQDSIEAMLDTMDFWERVDLMTAEGEYILVRGADRNYDTIIDHFRYRFTTEE